MLVVQKFSSIYRPIKVNLVILNYAFMFFIALISWHILFLHIQYIYNQFVMTLNDEINTATFQLNLKYLKVRCQLYYVRKIW
jgi:hypothetical protein